MLELKKDKERIRDLEMNLQGTELSQADINKCIMKEHPEGLAESLRAIIQKMSIIKKYKKKELERKKDEEQKKRKLVNTDGLGTDSLTQLREEALFYKERAELEEKYLSDKIRDIKSLESKEKIM